MHRHPNRIRRALAALNRARYHESGTPYHIISKTLRGEYFLCPTAAVTRIITGVIGRAQQNWPDIALYGYAFLSNHFHLMLQGDPTTVPRFVGFIKREISRRINQLFGSSGSRWHRRYSSSALPTVESQYKCLRYILAQGVKENIVTWSTEWPGPHCARQLLTGECATGEWLDGTAFGKAKHRGLRPSVRDFTTRYSVRLTRLPAWRNLTEVRLRDVVRSLLAEIAHEAAKKRKVTGKTVLGADKATKVPRTTCKPPPRPPWFEERKPMAVAWAKKRDPATRAYLKRRSLFQLEFRAAADALHSGELDAEFPAGAWRPAVQPQPICR